MYVCMYVSVSACSYVCMRTWLYTQWRVMSEIMNDIAYFLVHQWRHCDHSSRDIGIRDFVLSHSQPLNLTVTEKILRWIFFFPLEILYMNYAYMISKERIIQMSSQSDFFIIIAIVSRKKNIFGLLNLRTSRPHSSQIFDLFQAKEHHPSGRKILLIILLWRMVKKKGERTKNGLKLLLRKRWIVVFMRESNKI